MRQSNKRDRARVTRVAIGVLGTICASVCAVSPAAAQFTMRSFTIDSGGGTQSTGGTFTLGGTIGQPDAGLLTGATFTLGGGFWHGGNAAVGVPNADGSDDTGPGSLALPIAYRLHPASPNPVVDNTRVAFDLPHARSVRVRVYDVSGRLARTLVDEPLAAGWHHRDWDGTNDTGARVAAGMYFVLFDAGTARAKQKLVLLR
ncbi:MAG: FlgD immunoglobulin-like domain containing protein [bacterium]